MLNFADYLFRHLLEGTVVTVTMDSGQIIGPVVFVQYTPATQAVMFEEQGTISPPTGTIINVDVNKIESVSYEAQ
ncbi:hypothetical protein [Lederbergia galactosidilytica]|uniref:Uncharacterized protein n=1 Tax=Lederbergia galactosidilytica TaxID=217031 RepID=A0A0Q9YIW5_9BACI|nr:hypothetical protein [Lederbergia galactosidilytica]KRG13856.1 hypothetical protein ACA30_12985 [Virgibacillus soli]KRG16958.1 hypothetical protein ACA29_01910 [Lederbergia galactosidilytica]OAK74351.1 hypothetical protein ABB05_04345 [Lederbergia galactosidilytica]